MRDGFGLPSLQVSYPALLIADNPACERILATLTVLDRLVIATHKAGAKTITIVHSGKPPSLTRANALGIAVNLTESIPALHEPTLLLAGNLAVQENDLTRVISKQGRLYTPNREALPCGVAMEWDADLETTLLDHPKIEAHGGSKMVKDGLTAIQAEDALWDTMGLGTDSFIDRNFNRPVGRIASKALIHTPISPNAISVAGTTIGVLAAWCFTHGKAHLMILGAVLLQLSAIIDCVDGDLARMLHKETRTGKWLNLGGDQLIHLCLLAGMGMGLYRRDDPSGPYLWLGVAAALGVGLSFLTILRAEQSESPLPRLDSFIARTANRDFSALLLLLAIADRVHWFFWFALFAVNSFWVYGAWLRRTDEAGDAS